jgi:GNAT superfamily N-acetyltransferase
MPDMPLIRAGRPADFPAFLALVRAFAEFEKLPGPTEDAAARLFADASGPRPRYDLSVVEEDGMLVAYAVSFQTYSTFLAKPTLFLEDIFVHPRARRRGIATAILAHLRTRAMELGCGRFEWMVLDWNLDAQKLYDGIGARRLDDWRLYRVDLE